MGLGRRSLRRGSRSVVRGQKIGEGKESLMYGGAVIRFFIAVLWQGRRVIVGGFGAHGGLRSRCMQW